MVAISYQDRPVLTVAMGVGGRVVDRGIIC